MDPALNLQVSTPTENTIDILYASLIGSINYCAISTRPEILYTTNKCTPFTSKPNITHWEAAKRIVHYLLHTWEYRITYTSHRNDIERYAHNLANYMTPTLPETPIIKNPPLDGSSPTMVHLSLGHPRNKVLSLNCPWRGLTFSRLPHPPKNQKSRTYHKPQHPASEIVTNRS